MDLPSGRRTAIIDSLDEMNPAAANALLKLERHTASLLNPLAERSRATAHTFVIDPLHGKRRTASASHPPTERRIARLHRQAAEMEGVE